MNAKVSLNEQSLRQLQETGELQVEEVHGIPLVLMTVDARDQLRHVVYDDGDWTDEEQNAVMAAALDDPEGWGAHGMDVYDEKYGHLFESDDKNK